MDVPLHHGSPAWNPILLSKKAQGLLYATMEYPGMASLHDERRECRVLGQDDRMSLIVRQKRVFDPAPNPKDVLFVEEWIEFDK